MKIGIDCRTILNPEKGEGAGVGHYTYQLVRHLIHVDKKNIYVLFFDRSVHKKRIQKFKAKNVLIKYFPFIQYTRFMPVSYAHFLTSAALSRENLDVFHSPVCSLPRSYKGNSIVTVHDLSVYKFSEPYSKKQISELKNNIPKALERAKKIIAVSKSTSKDLKEVLNIDKKKIKVVYHGVDKRFFSKKTDYQIKKIRKKYGITKKYFLFIGTLNSRKNIIRIISSYERFRNKLVTTPKKSKDLLKGKYHTYQLVLAGAKGTDFKEIQKKASKSEYKKDIVFPGYVNANDLGALFKGSEIFIFPSLYEGFGIPIIEAMATKIPIITSNVSSMPEIAKNHAIIIDPCNVSDITQSIYDLLTNKKLKRTLVASGYKYAKEFNWDKCAKQTLKIYNQLLK